jgi:C4-dicarboxylate transporter, DctM subunit
MTRALHRERDIATPGDFEGAAPGRGPPRFEAIAPAPCAIEPERGARMLSRVIDRIAHAGEILVVAAISVDLIVTFCNTIARYAFGSGIPWGEDASTIALAIITFVGGACYFRRGSGMAYTAAVDRAHGRRRGMLIATGLWISLLVCAVSLYVFPEFFRFQLMQRLPVLGLSHGVVSIWMGLGFFLIGLYAFEKMLALGWREHGMALFFVLCIAVFLLVCRGEYFDGFDRIDPLVPIALVMAIGFLTAVPIALVLAFGGVAFLFITGKADLVAGPAAYQAGIGSFILLAIPFFLLAGALMEVTGMARRLVDLVQEWIGHWKGGLLLAEVVAMYVFSGMSGSKAADVATVGSVMKGPLRAYGYPPTESVAVLAAAAAMGEVIPPSLALLILGSITTLSVGTLFLAGIVPAALLAIVLMLGIVVRARRNGFPKGPRFRLRRALASVLPAGPALLVPIIVVGGIVLGIASPTESSSFAVIYGILVSALLYRSITLRSAWPALRDSALTAGMVLLMIGTANLLSQAIVIDGLSRTLTQVMGSLGGAQTFLFVSVAAIVVLGFVLEGFPAILISAPVLLPIAQRFGVDPLQYGILLVMAVGIGVFMPPIGVGYYIACAVGDAPAHETMRPSLVYNLFLLIGLVLVILFPGVTLAVPHLLGF